LSLRPDSGTTESTESSASPISDKATASGKKEAGQEKKRASTNLNAVWIFHDYGSVRAD
jgi:hypothetical protein